MQFPGSDPRTHSVSRMREISSRARPAVCVIATLIGLAGCATEHKVAHTTYAPQEGSLQIMNVPVVSDVAVIEDVPRQYIWKKGVGAGAPVDGGALFSGPQHFVWQVPQPDLASIMKQEMPPPSESTASNTVYFHVDSSQLDAKARAGLDVLPIEASHVQIDGYTDNTGTSRYNRRLSERRALAVKRYLMVRGVDAAKITTTAHGESGAVASNHTAHGRALNRRADVMETLE
ncbi:OmpA family protein [Burkholderia cenocepacia]|uniref:OmpA family protein n=1 Tax=Burkholderia cenocepacia TaxID=95486 RepID=UPI001BA23CCA|nr:OmpA family protein [Burkholderia cenocepacia]MBR8043108.1 OmpA family protein [Burkholderia cenocepacia]MBR8324522.1 OmpA family protein [Burkholderia cenocepacia]